MSAPHPVSRIGKYTILHPLASGGMAELFLARADGIEGFSKLVVLKRILPHRAANERFIRMFLNEARLVATLDHPNIAQVYDIGVEGDEYFFTMEYVHGKDVRGIMHHHPVGLPSLAQALHIAIGVCAGLHFAHEARDASGKPLHLVHRDVNPQNVLVSYDGAVKLVDFGIAKAASAISETEEGTVKGKYGYMSPEQCLGAQLDRRSDIFTLGIMLWEMTVGRRLYKINGELVTLQRIVYVDAPKPSRFRAGYPPALEAIVMKALSRSLDGRYQTAQEMQLDLEKFALDERLAVSSIAMSREMERIFPVRVSAWKQAMTEGRSLADLVQTQADDDDGVSESSEGALELDAVLADLADLGAMVPTVVQRSAQTRPAQTRPSHSKGLSSPDLAKPPTKRGRLWVWVALLGCALAGSAIAMSVVMKDRAREPTDHTVVATVTTPDAAVVAIAAAPDANSVGRPQDPPPRIGSDADAAIPDPVASPDAGVPSVKKPNRHGERHPPQHGPIVVPNEPVAPDTKPPDELPMPPTPDPVPLLPPATGSATPPGPAPGTVDATKVRAVVRTHVVEIQTCIERARMDDRDLKGKIVIRIGLSAEGRVTSTAIAGTTVGATATDEMGSCMMKAVASWSFPAPAGHVPATISYPFAF